jgi:hypothetical protein
LTGDELLERETDEDEVTSTRPALVTPPGPVAADDGESDVEPRAAMSGDDSHTPRPAPAVEHETPYLSEQTSSETNERWRHIQSEFVDDPRKSVAEAHELVGEVVQRIVDAFANERNDLERQWSKGDSISTEDLRVCLQRYRAFFSRLLPSMKGLNTHD